MSDMQIRQPAAAPQATQPGTANADPPQEQSAEMAISSNQQNADAGSRRRERSPLASTPNEGPSKQARVDSEPAEGTLAPCALDAIMSHAAHDIT